MSLSSAPFARLQHTAATPPATGTSLVEADPASRPDGQDDDYVSLSRPAFGGAVGVGIGTTLASVASFSTLPLLACAAIGGVAGAVLISQSARHKVGSFFQKSYQSFQDFRTERRLQREVAAREEEMFQEKVEAKAGEIAEARWAQEGQSESHRLADQLFQSRVEREAPGLVEARVASEMEDIVADRARQQLEGPRASEIDARVHRLVEEKVEERVTTEAATAMESRLEAEVAARVKSALVDNREEIDSRVEERVAQKIETLAQRKIDEANEVSQLDLLEELVSMKATFEEWLTSKQYR